MMDACNDRSGIQAAHNQTAHAKRKGQQALNAADNAMFHGGEDGSDDGIGQVAGGKDADQGGDKEIEHSGDDFMQPLLDKAHHPNRDNHRDDAALIAHQIDLVQAEPHALGPQHALCGHGPGVLEVWVYHQHTNDRPQIRVSAKGFRRAVGNQNRQEDIGGIGKEIGENVNRTGGIDVQEAVVYHKVQRFHNAHQETAGHNRRNDGHKDVSQAFDGPLEQGLFRGGGGLHVFLAGGGQTGDLQEFVVDLVHRPCADDQLKLAVGAEHAFNALHVLQGLHVNLAVVHRYQPQPGCAMSRAYQILPPAQITENLFRAFPVIQCHHGFLPFIFSFLKSISFTDCDYNPKQPLCKLGNKPNFQDCF